MGDAFAACERSTRALDRRSHFGFEFFVFFYRGIRDSPRNRIKHCFEKTYDGGELRRWKLINQLMGVLFLVVRISCHVRISGSQTADVTGVL